MIIDAIEVRLFVERRRPTPHVHPCPECYEDAPCGLACTIEPDLERDNGTPAGSHEVCGLCRKAMGPT